MSGLEVVGLEKRFDSLEVLRGLDLAVPPGSFAALLGASGSGKTTLLRILAGFERADRGRVVVEGSVVDDGVHALAPERRRIGYVPQEGALFPHMTVARNVGFGLRGRAARPGRRARVAELLEMVGLGGLGPRYPHQLSGGQQQRVALARALAVSPSVILLDEPFSSLDAELRASVRSDVLDVLRRAGTTTLFVTHDQDEALSSAEQVSVLVDGAIAQSASPRELYERPATPQVAAFLGAANLLPGTFEGARVRTGFGALEVLAPPGTPPRSGAAVVLVRPEQLEVTAEDRAAERGEVVQCEFYGHDVVLRVHPDGAPDAAALLARVAGHRAVPVGSRVGMVAVGPVVAWASQDPRISPPASENTAV